MLSLIILLRMAKSIDPDQTAENDKQCSPWSDCWELQILATVKTLIRLICFVCLCWGLMSQSTIFQSCRDGATASWVINQYFRGVKCLAQGHNTAAVGLEPPTSCSGVRHSTTEPPRSPRLATSVEPDQTQNGKKSSPWPDCWERQIV